TPSASTTSGTASSAAAAMSAHPATRSGCPQRYACASVPCFQSPALSQSRWPPSTAAKIAPTAPMPRPATRSIRSPASCSARSTPAWYAPAVPVPVSTSAVRSRVEYGLAVSAGASEVITCSVVNRDELGDLEVAFGAVGRLDDDLVALFLVEQRATDRRRRGDESLVDVGVFRHHELVDDRLAVPFLQRDRRSEPDFVPGDPVQVHQLDLGHALLKQADTGFDEALPLFRGVVFRVFAQVAELARALDLARQLGFQLLVELRDLVLELLQDPVFHRQNGSRISRDGTHAPAPAAASEVGR